MASSTPKINKHLYNSRLENQALEYFCYMADMVGAPKSIAAIYSLFFMAGKPLCMQDVQDCLNLSQGSVSNGIRCLKELGILKTVEGEIARRDYYILDGDPKTHLRLYLEVQFERRLAGGFELLDMLQNESQAQLHDAASRTDAPDSQKTYRKLVERLERLQQSHRQIWSAFPELRIQLAK